MPKVKAFVFWLVALIAVACLTATGPAFALTVTNQVVTADPLDNSPCTTPIAKAVFSPTDTQVAFWVNASNIINGDTLEWRWFSPDNNLYTSSQLSFSFSGNGCAWGSILIKGQQAAGKPGIWRVSVIKSGVTLTSSTFTITAPVASPPSISFSPPSNGTLTAGQSFDLSISVDFGPTLSVTGISVSLDGFDVTAPFLSLISAGYIRVSLNGSVITATVPGLRLPAGQHQVIMTISSPGGTGTGQWNATAR